MDQKFVFGMNLWTDSVLYLQYPRLASIARDIDIFVLEVMQAEDLDSLFLLPLSQQAFDELDSLQVQLQALTYDEHTNDCWTPS
jgi:hypothetical protein